MKLVAWEPSLLALVSGCQDDMATVGCNQLRENLLTDVGLVCKNVISLWDNVGVSMEMP